MKARLRPEIKAVFAVLVGIAGLKVTLVAMARTKSIKSVKRFYKKIDEKPKKGFPALSVVMFYQLDRDLKKNDRETYDNMKEIDDLFEDVSSMDLFKDAEIRFLQVNLGKKDAKDLKYDFNIQTVPTFMLFKDGVPLRTAKQAPVRLTGFIGQNELYTFINKNFERDIKAILNAKKTERAEKRERRGNGPRVGFSLGYGGYPYGYYPYGSYYGGYPYYGYGYPYYGGSGVGFSIGF